MRLALPTLLFSSLSLFAGPVLAAPSDAAAAQVLFDEALALMERGRYAEACPKLEASQKIDPGAGTQYRLAQCYEQSGKPATAWALYVEVAQAARRAAKAEYAVDAQNHADALAPKLAHVQIEISPEARTIPGLTVSRDGTPLDAALFDKDLPIDAGEHTVRASAPGHVSFTAAFTVAGTTRTMVKVPALEVGDDAPPAPPTPPLKIAGIAIGGAGVAGVGLGVASAIVANSKWKTARADCPANIPSECTTAGVSLGHQANTFANVANIGFIAGGALVATGVTLFVISTRQANAAAAPTTGTLTIQPTLGGGDLAFRMSF